MSNGVMYLKPNSSILPYSNTPKHRFFSRYLIHRSFRLPIFGSSPSEIPDCNILFCD
jgi:hypothetical protein